MLRPRDYLFAYRALRAGARRPLHTVRLARKLGLHPALAFAIGYEWHRRSNPNGFSEAALRTVARHINVRGVRGGLRNYFQRLGLSSPSVRVVTEDIMASYAEWHAQLEVSPLRRHLRRSTTTNG